MNSSHLPVLELKPDCSRCCGLCCVAPAFVVSSEFAISKKPGKPCPKLTPDFRCSIHSRLRQEGFPGCVAYDCFGAGQRVTQITYRGRTWKDGPDVAEQMFEVFSVMQTLHSMLNYLAEALPMSPKGPIFDELAAKREEIEAMTVGTPEEILAVDLRSLRREVGDLLTRFSALVRTPA